MTKRFVQFFPTDSNSPADERTSTVKTEIKTKRLKDS